MNAKMNLRLLATFVGFTLSAFAQIDGTKFASDLRTKYGPPLTRETFTVRSGIEMIVDYAANGHVCRIQLPPVGPGRDPGVSSPQAIDELISELVPLTMRGKELRRMMSTAGRFSVLMVEYENVTVAEGLEGQRRTEVTVTFTKEACRERPSQ
jgi:hypothetical protein